MSENNLEELDKQFTKWCDSWLKYKEEAIASNNYDFYLFFLKETQEVFTKLYAKSEKEEALELEEEVIKQVTQEIKWISRKKKEKEIPF